jgi:hypothetical protein
MIEYYIDRLFVWGYIVWFLFKMGLLAFIVTLLLYLFFPPFERFFERLKRGEI